MSAVSMSAEKCINSEKLPNTARSIKNEVITSLYLKNVAFAWNKLPYQKPHLHN